MIRRQQCDRVYKKEEQIFETCPSSDRLSSPFQRSNSVRTSCRPVFQDELLDAVARPLGRRNLQPPLLPGRHRMRRRDSYVLCQVSLGYINY